MLNEYIDENKLANAQTNEAEMKKLNEQFNQILNADLAETSNIIAVSFKKTVLVRQYETEVIEGSIQVTVDRNITGVERAFIIALVETQIEYQAFANLLFKGFITNTEFLARKTQLLNSVISMKAKAEEVLNKNVDYLINKYTTVQQ